MLYNRSIIETGQGGTRMKSFRGEICIILSTLGFGSMGVLAKGIYESGYGVLATLTLRFYFASLVLLAYLVLSKESFRLTKKQGLLLAAIGGFFYSAFSICYFAGLRFTDASIVAFVFALYPVIVTLLNFFFFHESMSGKKILCLVLSVLALYFLTRSPGANVNFIGVVISLVGGSLYAIYTMLLDHKDLQSLSPVVTTFYIILSTGLVLSLLCLVRGERLLPISPSQGLSLLLLGIVSTAMAILTYNTGVRILGSTKASLIANFEALVSTILAMVFLGEYLTWIQWIGAFLMISVIFLIGSLDGKEASQKSS